MPRIDKLPLMPVGILLLALGAGSTIHAAGDACKPALDAEKKFILTPTHVYTTETAEFRQGRTTNSEMIYTGGPGGVIYVMVKGKWIRSTLTPTEMLKQIEENQNNGKVSCQYLRDEAVSGEPASVYSGHTESEDGKTAFTIWISKSKGLPLRQELDMDVGGGMGKSHRSMRYEYTGVKPPQGVQ